MLPKPLKNMHFLQFPIYAGVLFFIYLLIKKTIKVIANNCAMNLSGVNGKMSSIKGLNITKQAIHIRNENFIMIVIFLLNDNIIDYNYDYIFFIILKYNY